MQEVFEYQQASKNNINVERKDYSQDLTADESKRAKDRAADTQA